MEDFPTSGRGHEDHIESYKETTEGNDDEFISQSELNNIFPDNKRTYSLIETKEVIVGKPNLHKEIFTDYVTYKINNPFRFIEDTHRVERRYNEFLLFRQMLRNHWPGVYIPPLPPKQFSGNIEKDFVDHRRLFLNVFCVELKNISYLCNSEEFEIFLESKNLTTDLEKIPATPTYESISLKYARIFGNELNNDEDFNSHSANKVIQDYFKQITGTYDYLKNVYNFIEQRRVEFKSQKYQQKSEYNQLMNFEKQVISLFANGNNERNIFFNQAHRDLHSKANATLKFSENQYEEFDNWIRYEDLQVAAITETVLSLNKLVNKQDSKTIELNECSTEISNIIFNKKLLSSMYTEESKHKQIAELEKKKERLDLEITSIEIIIKFATFALHKHIKRIKEVKVKEYARILKYFALTAHDNNSLESIFWNGVNKKVSAIISKNQEELETKHQP